MRFDRGRHQRVAVAVLTFRLFFFSLFSFLPFLWEQSKNRPGEAFIHPQQHNNTTTTATNLVLAILFSLFFLSRELTVSLSLCPWLLLSFLWNKSKRTTSATMGAGTGGERVERWVEGWSVLPIEEWRANYMFKRNERRRRRDPASIIGRTNANLHTHTHRAQRAGSRFPPHIYFYVINLLLRLLFSLRLFLHGITNIFSLREIKMSPLSIHFVKFISAGFFF